jgi:hypothetical protein
LVPIYRKTKNELKSIPSTRGPDKINNWWINYLSKGIVE